MLKSGCILLSLWSALNLVPSLFIVIQTLFRGGHTPALYSLLTQDQVDALGPEALATVDSIALFANGMNIGFCLLTLAVLWLGLYRRQIWAFWGLLAGFTAALAAGIAADYAVGTVAPEVNWISGAILALGLGLAALGLFRQDQRPIAQ